GFKSLKQLIKHSFRFGLRENALRYYRQLLPYVRTSVTRNYSEKSINNILDFVSTSTDMEFLQEFYSDTLRTLEEIKNERLWLKCQLKLAKLYLDRQAFGRLAKVLKQLRGACQNHDGSDDQRKGTHLLEIFALEIQMYTETKNNKKLKELYQQCLSIKSAIPHPRIMGVIRECGGKMHMNEKNWSQAQTAFFESFKNYDEAGSPQRINVLKYLVLSYMLAESQINPFDSQETKPYANDQEIVAMTNLVSAFRKRDIQDFEKILKENRLTIMKDPFIREYIDEVLNTIRTQVIIRLIQPYSLISLEFVAQKLNITVEEVESLLLVLILDGKIDGKIDQCQRRLESIQVPDSTLYQVMEEWSDQLNELNSAIQARISSVNSSSSYNLKCN
ncbi:hypothetical protein HMI56_001311, partial [Coelomomyces lativittatus]